MTPEEHYATTEEILEVVKDEQNSPARSLTDDQIDGLLKIAKIHAILATAVTAYDRGVIQKNFAPVGKYGGHTYQEGGITNQ